LEWGNVKLFEFGKTLALYPQQMAKMFKIFCQNEDNKNALEIVLGTGKVGVRFLDKMPTGDDRYWAVEDGILWMNCSVDLWGTFIPYYDEKRLEKKL